MAFCLVPFILFYTATLLGLSANITNFYSVLWFCLQVLLTQPKEVKYHVHVSKKQKRLIRKMAEVRMAGSGFKRKEGKSWRFFHTPQPHPD